MSLYEKPYSFCLGVLEQSFQGVTWRIGNPLLLKPPRCKEAQASHGEWLSGERDALLALSHPSHLTLGLQASLGVLLI